jgi:hypothetical protein
MEVRYESPLSVSHHLNIKLGYLAEKSMLPPGILIKPELIYYIP